LNILLLLAVVEAVVVGLLLLVAVEVQVDI
jgi:hypothetical protein